MLVWIWEKGSKRWWECKFDFYFALQTYIQ